MSAITAGRYPRVLASSATPATVTGTTSETQLAAVTVPANLMGANGGLRVTAVWSMTGAGGNRIPHVRFSGSGGTDYWNVALGSNNVALVCEIAIANKNAANSQKGGILGQNATTPLPTGSADTTQATTVYLSGSLSVGTDALTLEAYTVEFIPAA